MFEVHLVTRGQGFEGHIPPNPAADEVQKWLQLWIEEASPPEEQATKARPRKEEKNWVSSTSSFRNQMKSAWQMVVEVLNATRRRSPSGCDARCYGCRWSRGKSVVYLSRWTVSVRGGSEFEGDTDSEQPISVLERGRHRQQTSVRDVKATQLLTGRSAPA